MCGICRKIPCSSRCPNAPLPRVFARCSECGCDILEGEEYYEIINEPVCEDCVWNARKIAEGQDV